MTDRLSPSVLSIVKTPVRAQVDPKIGKMYNCVQNLSQGHCGGLVREQPMKQVSFTEFRRNAATLLNSVEKGETIVVLRHGKPIAEVVPVPPPDKMLSWKRPGIKLTAGRGASLSCEILKERKLGER